ncbi:MAG: outer membrane beta-barrel protein, partial [Candidatus Aminicenantales bacterium]
MGTVYPVESKTGDWYEIKYRSAIGVMLSGFIHKSQVEEVKEETPVQKAEPLQKSIAGEERAETAGGLRPGLEIGLSGGMGFPSFTGGSGSFTNTWSYNLLQTATETGNLVFSLKNPVTLSGSFAYFFTPSIGIRLQVDYPLKQSIESGTMDYTLSWKWTISPTTYSLSPSPSWGVTGDFSVIPISLNGVLRFPLGSTIDAYITAGPTYFMGTINASTTMGLGWSWMSGSDQHIDYFPVPLTISQSINGIGFNAGAGLDIRLGDVFGIFLEAAYFAGPSSSQNWIAQPGSYPSQISTLYTLPLTQAMIDSLDLSKRVSPLEV